MDRALYVAMTGASETLRQQAINNHNLANASTTGFRAELLASQAQDVNGPGLPTRVNSAAQTPGWDSRGGNIQQTGRNLDVAMAPDTWLAVQASDGSEAYTKAGDLQLDAYGQLRTASGQTVLGDAGPVTIPQAADLSIGGDGTITVQPLGSGTESLATVGRLKVMQATPDQLERGTDGLMRAKPGVALNPASGNVVTSGALESSNVNLPETMVNMISLARQFELQTKLMKTAEDNAAASSTLTRISG
ncbi:flagellar basal body rod protein FlgF [Solimonas marina]|uniref:Flagellar basal-body rod protein FlgF n=1 Tax=Solimonas marina TaxID=2714601 RepID=A0A970B5M9_9GAMM|nr:flagellar basal body rod protein FlgF [Solimonas marina]NKF21755.1 flagellar basal body rod protein FlgF [Solimonas marina]